MKPELTKHDGINSSYMINTYCVDGIFYCSKTGEELTKVSLKNLFRDGRVEIFNFDEKSIKVKPSVIEDFGDKLGCRSHITFSGGTKYMAFNGVIDKIMELEKNCRISDARNTKLRRENEKLTRSLFFEKKAIEKLMKTISAYRKKKNSQT